MSRPSKDRWFQDMATLVSRRSTCHRRAVGCVLVSERWHVLSTGYNGRAAGLPNCNDAVLAVISEEDRRKVKGWVAPADAKVETFPHRCPASDAPPGEPNGCESIHAEQNALLQCSDVYRIDTCYCNIAPCLVCVKLLLNTSCRRIVFEAEYAYPDAVRLWTEAGRVWMHLPAGSS